MKRTFAISMLAAIAVAGSSAAAFAAHPKPRFAPAPRAASARAAKIAKGIAKDVKKLLKQSNRRWARFAPRSRIALNALRNVGATAKQAEKLAKRMRLRRLNHAVTKLKAQFRKAKALFVWLRPSWRAVATFAKVERSVAKMSHAAARMMIAWKPMPRPAPTKVFYNPAPPAKVFYTPSTTTVTYRPTVSYAPAIPAPMPATSVYTTPGVKVSVYKAY